MKDLFRSVLFFVVLLAVCSFRLDPLRFDGACFSLLHSCAVFGICVRAYVYQLSKCLFLVVLFFTSFSSFSFVFHPPPPPSPSPPLFVPTFSTPFFVPSPPPFMIYDERTNTIQQCNNKTNENDAEEAENPLYIVRRCASGHTHTHTLSLSVLFASCSDVEREVGESLSHVLLCVSLHMCVLTAMLLDLKCRSPSYYVRKKR